MVENEKTDNSTNLELMAGIISLIMLMLAMPTLYNTCFPDDREALPILFWLSMAFTMIVLGLLFEKIMSQNKSEIDDENRRNIFRWVVRVIYSFGISFSLLGTGIYALKYFITRILPSIEIIPTLVLVAITIAITTSILCAVHKKDKKTKAHPSNNPPKAN